MPLPLATRNRQYPIVRALDAPTAFADHLRKRGQTVDTLNAEAAYRIMVRFYLDDRADDTDVASQGDMLLFQWGIHDWGDGPSFEYDITRQLIPEDGDDEDIWQLHLTLHFPPTEQARALEEGHVWCDSPDEIDSLVRAIEEHPATAYVRSVPPTRVQLYFEHV